MAFLKIQTSDAGVVHISPWHIVAVIELPTGCRIITDASDTITTGDAHGTTSAVGPVMFNTRDSAERIVAMITEAQTDTR